MNAYSLMYHDVVAAGAEDDSGFPGAAAAIYKLAPDHFDAHLAAVTRACDAIGCERVIDPAELARRAPDKPPAVLLHFDDGGASALSVADALECHDWRGFFHITSDRIGTPGFVTAGDIRELDRRGHVIGSHSRSHPPRLSSLPANEIRREWSDSIAALADILGHSVQVASVPGGYTSRAVTDAAEQAGITVLFNSEPVASYEWFRRCVVLGRYAIMRSTPASEAAAIASGERGPRWRQWALWSAKKAVKRAGGHHWLAMRDRILRRRAEPAA